MDLLEITNRVADSMRRIKENNVRDNGCTYELDTMVHVFRDGLPHVGLRVHDNEIAFAFRLARKIFFADAISIGVDGTSSVRHREELMTVTASKDGEIMWKVQPYATVGRMLICPGAEVTDKLPLAEPDRVEEEMRAILAEPDNEVPWELSKFPDLERAQAELDAATAVRIRTMQADGELPGAVKGIVLYAPAPSPRLDILTAAGFPVMFL